MNRVLSLPITHITPEQLELLQAQQHSTLVEPNGTIKLPHRNGLLELKFLQPGDYVSPGTPVCVWWKGGGFVCATQAELENEAQEAKSVAERVAQTRAMLAAARMERNTRRAAANGAPPVTAQHAHVNATNAPWVQPETTSMY